MSKRILAFLLCVALIFSLFACTEEQKTNTPIKDASLVVHYIDVGQGDSILLESNNEFVLIDAGEREYSPTVCSYLKDNDVDRLNYVIATHPHSDHCGGLADVLNTFECDNFITVETDQNTKTWIDVLLAVEDNGINYIDAKTGNAYAFGEASFEIMGPRNNNYEDYNNFSVVIKATCGDTSFLFTGDAEKLSEKEMINSGTDLSADVLKVGHHGSSTSSCEEFIDAVDPAYAVITCGKGNDYGHPHKEVLNTLNSHAVTIYRTDISGTVIAYSDKENISFDTKFTDNISETSTATEKPSDTQYIGNKNSKKFHLTTCSGAQSMSEKNRIVFSTRSEAVQNGYEPCKTCNP